MPASIQHISNVTHTHTLTNTHTHTHSLTHTHTLTHSHSLTHTHPLTYSLYLQLFLIKHYFYFRSSLYGADRKWCANSSNIRKLGPPPERRAVRAVRQGTYSPLHLVIYLITSYDIYFRSVNVCAQLYKYQVTHPLYLLEDSHIHDICLQYDNLIFPIRKIIWCSVASFTS